MSRYLPLAPFGSPAQAWGDPAASTTYRLDADTEKFAVKFYADRTSEITAVDVYLDINGTVTDINFDVEIQTDSSDTPSGTPVGTASAAFAGAADGWTGAKSLATPTGALTLNTPYWMVIKRASGSSLTASNYIQPFVFASLMILNGEKIRQFNGTDWTTVTARSSYVPLVFTHGDGSFSGFPVTGVLANSAQANIHGTARQGLRVKYGSQVKIIGAGMRLTKTASPSALEVLVYEGTTEKYSNQILAANVPSNAGLICWFSSPVLLAADTNLYIILRQVSDGGDASNHYDLRTQVLNSSYINAVLPPDMRLVAGTGNDPTALTVITTEIPNLFPIVIDPAANFDMSASGGGIPIIGGSIVRAAA